MTGRGTRTLAERVEERAHAFGRAAAELGRVLVDVGLFVLTIVVVWGGITWLGYELDRFFGTAPRVSIVVGQSGPFAMLGVISGMLLSLYAANWVAVRRRRR